ncbi:hypothetical protein JL193_11195 [Polaribacter batillariae]|uniref:Uncharacterized protein n=1 Tax=Polaribacter batillariae TaxID=2808900 RepID=A0ABX7SV31_9FLAO|nr:hypothetical protein [Polaribacter batillariae]QTD36703.1 hypothetical protein JL193_11195 [Polaribacter batillariae]
MVLDSLLTLSKKAKDTLLVKVLNEISWEYKNSDLDTSYYFAKTALKKALFINNKKSIAQSYNSLGRYLSSKI